MLYVRPATAANGILDRGKLWFSIVTALAVSVALHVPDLPERGAASPLLRFISYTPGGYLAPLVLVAIAMVPAIILVRAWSGFGSFPVLFDRDFAPLLMCSMFSWAAAYLPLAIARYFVEDARSPMVYLAFDLYFMVLLAFCVRAVFGSGFGAAFGLTLAGWIGGAIGAVLLGVVGPGLGYLASPFVLYYLWIAFGSRMRGIGEGIRSGQHFRRQLEMATANPHDADAHYQLGLIYQQRRQYSDAIARFARAVEIDKEFADASMQLGVIAREQGRFEDAIGFLEKAASLDDKLAQSDVWRELGASYFGAGRVEDAGQALGKYVSRREYDPEGLYWYGMVLKKMGRAEAREMFERAIEAVKTMPSHRRAQVRQWAGKARSEL
ncbi:MAG: tetratricopeptide repeat protein [Acidobacteriia bacterium]|nr:tetratricopeptide repeat protein [Terriglobia bacterium]